MKEPVLSSVTIVRENPPASVTVTARVALSAEPVDLKNSAIKEGELRLALDSDAPNLTNLAIYAACTSAMFFARRRVGGHLSVELVAYSWTGKVEDADQFAIAMRLAIERAFGQGDLSTFDPAWILQSEESRGGHGGEAIKL